MSIEAWGDEGNVPIDGAATATYQEWLDVVSSAHTWWSKHKADFPNEEIDQHFINVISDMNDYAEALRIALDPNV